MPRIVTPITGQLKEYDVKLPKTYGREKGTKSKEKGQSVGSGLEGRPTMRTGKVLY